MAEGTAVETPVETTTEVKKEAERGNYWKWLRSLEEEAKKNTTTKKEDTKVTGAEITTVVAAIKEGIPVLKELLSLLGAQTGTPGTGTVSTTIDIGNALVGVGQAIADVAVSLHEIAEAIKK